MSDVLLCYKCMEKLEIPYGSRTGGVLYNEGGCGCMGCGKDDGLNMVYLPKWKASKMIKAYKLLEAAK